MSKRTVKVRFEGGGVEVYSGGVIMTNNGTMTA
jgi:hypothetical protein